MIIDGRDEGMTTFANNELADEPIERADFIRRGSTLFTPLIVLSKMGHCAPQNITAIFDISPIPRNKINTGKRDWDEVYLNICTRPSVISSKSLFQPIKNPSGIIVIAARENPVRARCRLILVCSHSSPEISSLIRASKTSDGGARNVLLIMPLTGSNSQISRNASSRRTFLKDFNGIRL